MENTIQLFKIKSKYFNLIARNAWTSLDITQGYSLETWKNAGFKERVLEKI